MYRCDRHICDATWRYYPLGRSTLNGLCRSEFRTRHGDAAVPHFLAVTVIAEQSNPSSFRMPMAHGFFGRHKFESASSKLH
jgi:hypothetical protein